jgi:hypothetical protein
MLTPTDKQVRYLAKLTGIRSRSRQAQYVARRMGRALPEKGAPTVSRFDYIRVIDGELRERHALR